MKPIGALLARVIAYGAIFVGSTTLFAGIEELVAAIVALILLEVAVLSVIDKAMGMPSVREGMLRRLRMRE